MFEQAQSYQPISNATGFDFPLLGGSEPCGKRRRAFANSNGPNGAEGAGASEALGLRVRARFRTFQQRHSFPHTSQTPTPWRKDANGSSQVGINSWATYPL